MKSEITIIKINRTMRATRRYGFSTDTEVAIYRNSDNGFVGKIYNTNPLLDNDGRISNASVLRAKRAQLALMANDDTPAPVAAE
jgi:hypothetical protein